MSRATRRMLMIVAVVLVAGSAFSVVYHGPDWLGTILGVVAVLVLISCLDWLKGRRLKARRLKARGLR
jgi:uncharacterized membrane protein YkvI